MKDTIDIKTKTIAEINGKEYDVLYEFQVAIPGWECDSTSYIVLIDGEPRLLNSDHGSFYVVSKDENESYSFDEDKTVSIRDDVFVLQDDIRRYQHLIEQNQTAINFLLPPPLEINEGFEPSKTYDPDKQIPYHEVMDLVQASNRFNDQYLELAGLIFDEYKKVCDASEYDVSPEMAVIGKFLKKWQSSESL